MSDEKLSRPVKDMVEIFNKMSDSHRMSTKVDIRDDKEKLLHKLQLTRKELDAYIRQSKKMIDEIRNRERENETLKVKLELSNRRISRLEKFESSLRSEFSQMCKLLCETPQSQKDISKTYDSIMNSLSILLDEKIFVPASDKLCREFEDIKDEIVAKRQVIADLQKEINDLSAFRKKLINQNHDISSQKPLISTVESQKLRCPIRRSFSTQKDEDQQSNETLMKLSFDNALENFFSKQLFSFKQAIDSFESEALCKMNDPIQLKNQEKLCVSLSVNSIPLTCLDVVSKYEKSTRGIFNSLLSKAIYLDSKAYEFHELNKSLNGEIESLKYALSHRIEMQQLRDSIKGKNCNCQEEIDELHDEISALHKELKNKETELEVAEENRYYLLQLMACMDGTNSNNQDINIDSDSQKYLDPSLE